METEKLGSLRRRGFPGGKEDRKGQYRDHTVEELEVELFRLCFDAGRRRRRRLNGVCMKPLPASCAVAAYFGELVSTGWTGFHA